MAVIRKAMREAFDVMSTAETGFVMRRERKVARMVGASIVSVMG